VEVVAFGYGRAWETQGAAGVDRGGAADAGAVGAAWHQRQALALRARMVLACAEGATNVAVAEQLGIWPQTVAKWRGRFVAERLEGLSDEPRPGRPRTISDGQVEAVIVATLEQPPPDHDTHWSTRSMARPTGMNQTAISRIWRAFGLKPHLEQTWKLSADPQFIDKVRDIVGLYLDPPERALVLCVDEKSQIQALDRSAPTLPILPTTPARRSHDYVRHGTPACSRPWTWPLARSSPRCTAATATRSSSSSCAGSRSPCRPEWSCTWSATTTPPTRPRRSTPGCCATPGSTCISPRPRRAG
jgi:transposase